MVRGCDGAKVRRFGAKKVRTFPHRNPRTFAPSHHRTLLRQITDSLLKCAPENWMYRAPARLAAAAVVMGSVLIVTLDAQWDPYPWKNMPRKADGSVDMAAPPRRTAD